MSSPWIVSALIGATVIACDASERVLPLPAQLKRFEAEVLGGRNGEEVIENHAYAAAFIIGF